MADGSFSNVYVGVPSGGILQFQGTASNAVNGYGIYRTTSDTLQFQGGGGGYLFVNSANSAVVLKMADGGDVGVGTAAPLARLEVRGATNQYETLALSGDSQSTLTMRTKTSPSLPAAIISSNYGNGSAGAIAGSTTRVESGGGFAVGVGVTSFHAGNRVVLNIPNDPNHGYVQLRAPGSGVVLLQLQSSVGVNQLGMYVSPSSGEGRVAARGELAFSAGNAEYTAVGEVMRLLTNGNVGIGTPSPEQRLHIKGPDFPSVKIESTTNNNPAVIFASAGATGAVEIQGATKMRLSYSGPSNIEFATGGAALAQMVVAPSGNVGIGTLSPNARLQVGEANSTPNAPQDGRIITAARNTSGAGYRAYEFGTSETWGFGFAIRDQGANATRLLIDLNGNVGIGASTPDPAFRLHVNGKARVEDDLTVSKNVSVVEDLNVGSAIYLGSGAQRKIADPNGCYYA